MPFFKTLLVKTPSSQNLWRITWPMILANISVPLLGFVDTAVVGHLSHPGFLAGTALGSLLVTVLFWLLGFLRMSTTGLVAQANNDHKHQAYIIGQGALWSCLLACIILLSQNAIFSGLLLFVEQGDMNLALESAEQYFSIRIWVAPFALMNLVLAGFYIGRGLTKVVLIGVLIGNGVNLILDILLVPVLGLGVKGVAYATVVAEFSLFLFYSLQLAKHLAPTNWISAWVIRFDTQILKLNSRLFFRSFLLQLCISFLTIYATRFGDVVVAVNAILMQFFLFISFSLDGVAFALESLVGKTKGQKSHRKMMVYIRTGLIMATGFALFYALIYLTFHSVIIGLLTNIASIKQLMDDYVIWILLFPLVSYLSFVMDGIFVGLAWSQKMLSSMLLASLVYFTVFIASTDMQNHGLWLAFSCFMLTRGLTQALMLQRYSKRFSETKLS